MWAEFTQIRANLREFIRVRGEQSFAKPSAQITTLRTSIILRMYFHVFGILTSRSIFEIFAWIIKCVFYGKIPVFLSESNTFVLFNDFSRIEQHCLQHCLHFYGCYSIFIYTYTAPLVLCESCPRTCFPHICYFTQPHHKSCSAINVIATY